MLRDFTKERFDVVIQAGQSNAEGYGFGPVEKPYQPTDRVWYLNADFTVSIAAEKVTGNEIQSNFSLSFAERYVKEGLLAEGRKLLIIRSAVGGTGFCTHEWGPEDPLYLRMIDLTKTAMELNPENRLVGLLWHQGENEADRGVDFDTHCGYLSTFVRLAREAFGAPDLPFVAGDFVEGWRADHPASKQVSDAMRAVCRDAGHAAFVETDGLLSNLDELHRNPLGWEDPIHFSRKAIYALGERYFDAFRTAAGK